MVRLFQITVALTLMGCSVVKPGRFTTAGEPVLGGQYFGSQYFVWSWTSSPLTPFFRHQRRHKLCLPSPTSWIPVCVGTGDVIACHRLTRNLLLIYLSCRMDGSHLCDYVLQFLCSGQGNWKGSQPGRKARVQSIAHGLGQQRGYHVAGLPASPSDAIYHQQRNSRKYEGTPLVHSGNLCGGWNVCMYVCNVM